MLRRYPYVLWMDCTYKTNIYKIPLLDIVGATSTGNSFYAGFAFIQNEREASYRLIFDCLQELAL
jgi:hypothetical protein